MFFLCISNLSFLHQKSIPIYFVFQDSFLETPLLLILWQNKFDFGPLRNPAGTKMGPKIDQVAPNWYEQLSQGFSWNWCVKRWNAEWIGPSFCLCFALFALSNFSGTITPNISRKAKRIGPSKSSGRQNGTQTRPSNAKCHQNLRRRRSFLRSWNRLVAQSVPKSSEA